MRGKSVCAALLVPAAAAAIGLHFNGGLTAFGDLESTFAWGPWVFKDSEPLGNSYYVGGGGDVPLWRYAGGVSPTLGLATDVGFTSKTKRFDREELRDLELSWNTVAIRESLVFGLGAGPATPFIGFGGGVAIVPWTSTQISTGVELDSHTEFKPAFGIPFGCEFALTPHFGLGFHAEYLIITGDATPAVEVEGYRIAMADPFFLTGRAQFNL